MDYYLKRSHPLRSHQGRNEKIAFLGFWPNRWEQLQYSSGPRDLGPCRMLRKLRMKAAFCLWEGGHLVPYPASCQCERNTIRKFRATSQIPKAWDLSAAKSRVVCGKKRTERREAGRRQLSMFWWPKVNTGFDGEDWEVFWAVSEE